MAPSFSHSAIAMVTSYFLAWSKDHSVLVFVCLDPGRIPKIQIRSIDAIGMESISTTVIGMGNSRILNTDHL